MNRPFGPDMDGAEKLAQSCLSPAPNPSPNIGGDK